MRLYVPKILFPAMDLPLDINVIVEVEEDIGKALIHKGWIVEEGMNDAYW